MHAALFSALVKSIALTQSFIFSLSYFLTSLEAVILETFKSINLLIKSLL